MILADTSVWIEHFRGRDSRLTGLLNQGGVLMHPFIIGELALGTLTTRDVIIAELLNLLRIGIATDDEALRFIGAQSLYGMGIGYIDAHLLAATRLDPGTALWTYDTRLKAAAAQLNLAAILSDG